MATAREIAELLAQEVNALEESEHVQIARPEARTNRYGSARFPNVQPIDPRKGLGYSNEAEFLKETHENTLTWAALQAFSFTQAGGGEALALNPPATQLVQLSRKRPTSYTLITVVTFGAANWTGEPALVLVPQWIVGEGQAKVAIVRQVAVAAPANSSQVLDTLTVPATSIQGIFGIVGTSTHAGVHDLQVYMGAAPVYA